MLERVGIVKNNLSFSVRFFFVIKSVSKGEILKEKIEGSKHLKRTLKSADSVFIEFTNMHIAGYPDEKLPQMEYKCTWHL